MSGKIKINVWVRAGSVTENPLVGLMMDDHCHDYDESEGEGRAHPNTNPNLTLSLRPVLTSVVVRQWATCTCERDWCHGDERWW